MGSVITGKEHLDINIACEEIGWPFEGFLGACLVKNLGIRCRWYLSGVERCGEQKAEAKCCKKSMFFYGFDSWMGIG
nr:hypothetical protein [uncultured Desulfobulbus sp.]